MFMKKKKCKGDMLTVVRIFENHYKMGKKLPVAIPSTQARRFTHIFNTV